MIMNGITKSQKVSWYTRSIMEDNKETPLDIKYEILSELWVDYRTEEDFKDFIHYNDLGLPLSFLLSEKIVSPTDQAIVIINETFDLFLAALEINEDQGYETLDDLLGD